TTYYTQGTRHRLLSGEETGLQRDEDGITLQDRMGSTALLGEAVQHLWWHLVPEADCGSGLVSEQWPVHQDRDYPVRLQLRTERFRRRLTYSIWRSYNAR